MATPSCAAPVKVFIFFSSIFLLLIGSVVVFLGARARLSGNFHKLSTVMTVESNDFISSEFLVLAVIGLVVLTVCCGCWGCFAAIAEKQCTLCSFSSCGLILGVLLLAASLALHTFVQSQGPIILKIMNRLCGPGAAEEFKVGLGCKKANHTDKSTQPSSLAQPSTSVPGATPSHRTTTTLAAHEYHTPHKHKNRTQKAAPETAEETQDESDTAEQAGLEDVEKGEQDAKRAGEPDVTVTHEEDEGGAGSGRAGNGDGEDDSEGKQDAGKKDRPKIADKEDTAEKGEPDAAKKVENAAADTGEPDIAAKGEKDSAEKEQTDAAEKSEPDIAENGESHAAKKGKLDSLEIDMSDIVDQGESDVADKGKHDAVAEDDSDTAEEVKSLTHKKGKPDAADKDKPNAAEKAKPDAAGEGEPADAEKHEPEDSQWRRLQLSHFLPRITAPALAELRFSTSYASRLFSRATVTFVLASEARHLPMAVHGRGNAVETSNQTRRLYPGISEESFLVRSCSRLGTELCPSTCNLLDQLCKEPPGFNPWTACVCDRSGPRIASTGPTGLADAPCPTDRDHPMCQMDQSGRHMGVFCMSPTPDLSGSAGAAAESCFVLPSARCAAGTTPPDCIAAGEACISTGPCSHPDSRSQLYVEGREMALHFAVATGLLGIVTVLMSLCACCLCAELHTGRSTLDQAKSLGQNDPMPFEDEDDLLPLQGE